ncbi:hypothetical protein [Clostridium sardiniense]|uniref:hypothetical protein n=1 Tax=Clostridium sardiniense TaxID=29369 RepID=UPI00195904F2|nr:hypothetical protein [Clostridium sardiniense]MBM7834931.1 hypothetical protein [Clostridium sardiniense]
MDINNFNMDNFFSPYTFNANLGDESGNPEDEERRQYFLRIDLEIVNIELFGTCLSVMSSFYYLKASLIGKEIVLSALNGIDSGLDATPYINVGETLGLMVNFIFAYSAFKRYEEKSEQDPEHQDPYRRIAMSYIPTILAYLVRVNARSELISTLPNI